MRSQSFLTPTRTLFGLALLKLAIHFVTNTTALGYSYFRDELYYWVCSIRLDWGYVDHPPLAPLLLHLNSLLFGDSLFAWRLLPALAGAGMVILAGLMARELGGGLAAQTLAALAVVVAPIYLIIDSFFSTNAFEALIWAACAYVLLRLFKTQEARLWLVVGALIGLGLQTKHTTVFWIIGLGVAVLLTSARRYLLNRWLWLGGALAFIIFLPNLVWQLQNNWASVEFYRAANFLKNVPTPAVDIVVLQVILLNPFAAPLWLAGLYFYLFTAEGHPYRSMAWIYLTILALLIISQSSRPDRPAGAYPMLLAAGAVVVETWARRRQWRWPMWALGAALTVAGIALAPISLPILPPDVTARFAAAVGLSREIEKGKLAPLPQYLADRFGWESAVATVAQVYQQLSPAEQAQTSIITISYGEAGAIDYFGSAYGLPNVISGHNNYYVWGPRGATGAVVIALGFPEADLREAFASVEQVAALHCDFCLIDGMPVYVARGLQTPIEQLWPQVKHYE